MIRVLIAFGLTASLGTVTQPLSAQRWHLDVSGGRIHSVLDPGAVTRSLALGLRYDDRATGARLSAGVPTGQDEALWGTAAAWRRLAVRHGAFVAGLDLSGTALISRERARQQDRLPGLFGSPAPAKDRIGRAYAGQALPLIGYEGVNIELHVRAGLSSYAASFDSATLSRRVRTADAQLTYAPTANLMIIPALRHFDPAAEPAATYAGVTALYGGSTYSVWASTGRFVNGVEGDVDPAAYAAGFMLRVHDRLSMNASARRDTFDPLYLTPPQTSWQIGGSILVGGRPFRTAAPVPAAYEAGRATITLPVEHAADSPRIAGDFNGWSPQPMRRDGDVWSFTFPVEPGVYSYAFVTSDDVWFVPDSVAGRKDDGMGGHVAVLVVE